MKELTKLSRVQAYIEKLYDKINADIFAGSLTRPVITIQSSTKAWGHLTVHDAWSIKGEGYRELNISTASLMRPIEATIGTLVHEMCHQYDLEVLGILDCSNKGLYHNRTFKQTAEAHGLILACGGAVQPKLGGTNDGYQLLQKLGHTIVSPAPALVPINTDRKSISGLSGRRHR